MDDPSFDLDEPIFDRGVFNINTPVNKINSDLANFKNKFTVAHINARSLCKNIEELREIINKTNFDAVAISETWLTQRSPRNRFILNNYSIFRNDRKTNRGGGVLWYIRDHYHAKLLKTPSSLAIPEILWIEVTSAGKKLLLVVCIRHPRSHMEFLQTFMTVCYLFMFSMITQYYLVISILIC